MTSQKSTAAQRILKGVLVLLPLFLVGLQWLQEPVRTDNFLLQVPQVRLLPWLETRWAYFYLHALTFIPVFALSFDRNVHYYKKWRPLLPAIAIMAAIFILWDVGFTAWGVWGFNEAYFAGLTFLHLPVEEWLFFFIVPFACIFIYECLNFYIKKDLLAPLEKGITLVLILVFLVVGFLHWGRLYTSTTFLLAGFFVLYHFLFLDGRYRSRFYLAFLVSMLPFLLVNGVLTGGYTEQPIVIYNPEEYLGLRITSVPVDDAVYGFLLLFGVVTLYERFRLG